jgi:hypothetical protein
MIVSQPEKVHFTPLSISNHRPLPRFNDIGIKTHVSCGAKSFVNYHLTNKTLGFFIDTPLPPR